MSPTDPSNVPALAPPIGDKSNFVDPYSLSPAFIVTAVLCLLLATTALIIRLVTTLRATNNKIRIEELTCIISWLGLIVTCTLTVLEIHKGLGRHQWDVPKSDIEPMAKLFYVNRIFYSPTILAAKITILLQLMRIFVPTKRGLVYWLIQSLMWLNVCFYLANVVSVIFQCEPVHKAWQASIPGHCVDTNLNLVVTGSINVISDILILLLPLWTIWHLKMTIRAKLSVSLVFAAGIFANFAGIMRLVYSVRIIHGKDLTYLRMQHAMWTIAEITTAIICASLPLVPQFFNLFRPRSPKPNPTYIPSGSNCHKSHGGTESTGSLRGRNSEELGLRPGSDHLACSERGRVAAEKDKGVVLTGVYVPADDETEIGWDKGRGNGEDGIRKTVRIEQTF